MEKKFVVFSGRKHNEYGMPMPIHCYGIFATIYKEDEKYIAVTIIGVSEGVPEDTQGNKLIEAKSEEQAVGEVINSLKKHPLNEGLRFEVSDLPDIKF